MLPVEKDVKVYSTAAYTYYIVTSVMGYPHHFFKLTLSIPVLTVTELLCPVWMKSING